MNDRLRRIKEFEIFSQQAKDIFQAYSQADTCHKRLDDLYSLCICPGGRHGGNNDKFIEVFYGNHPIGCVTTITSEGKESKLVEMAYGATLYYYRTDDGYVLCRLYPARSENQRPTEDFILLDFIKNTSKLSNRSASHWKDFFSYMETTCIDGAPNMFQRFRVFRLRSCKQLVVNGVSQDIRAVKCLKDICKFVATVGLSGFLLFGITSLKDCNKDMHVDPRYNEIKQIAQDTHNEVSLISGNTEATARILREIAANTDRVVNITSAKTEPGIASDLPVAPMPNKIELKK